MKPMLTPPGRAVYDALTSLYLACCYAVPCPDCEALPGEPCRPYRLMASRSCRPPTAVATIDPHKPRRAAAHAVTYALGQRLAELECPACGGRVDVRFPSSPVHVCHVGESSSSLADDVAAALMGSER